MAKQQPSNTSLTIDPGKVPPHNLELEEAVIGALMLEQDAINDIIEIIKAESFYSPAHTKIFDAILFLFNNSQPINIISVCESLSKKGELETVGGRAYVAGLTSRVASTADIEYNAKIVAQKYIQRELIRVTSEIQRRSFDDGADVVDLIDFSENELFKISEGNIKKNVISIGQVVMESLRQIEANSKKESGLSGVPSGFTLMDNITNGWQPSDLVIVAARPSMGKTAFVLSMARNMVIEHQRPVAFFSLEMASVQLVNRLIASECEIPADKLRSGKLEDWEWQKLEQRIQN
ncbi:MAG: DnaB-like helicase C-terminal domain-containing protein, partial [Salinivirgaceae bacterium]|nr:DnaB-like helicase C-terminal domain-containing protein [Salinivirgaceae bacterium]